MMEAASTFETSVHCYQSTRRNIPEDSHLQIHTFLILPLQSLTIKKIPMNFTEILVSL
jgi:hypothetical protein